MRKRLCVKIITLLMIVSSIISLNAIMPKAVIIEDDIEKTFSYDQKIICNASLDDDFVDDKVIVAMNQDESLKFKTYKASDFSGVELSEVKELTKKTTQRLKSEYADLKAYAEEEIRSTSCIKNYNYDLQNRGLLVEPNASDASSIDKFIHDDSEKKALEQIKDENPNYRQILVLSLAEKSKENVLDSIKKLEKRDDILFAQPDYYFYADSVPNDYNNASQWGIGNANLPNAWNVTTGSNSIKVGILDSGIQGNHPDLQANINTNLSESFVDNYPLTDTHGHGTHVAGIIGAKGNNGIGVTGVCWNISLVSLKISIDGSSNTSYVISAIENAKEKQIELLNLSYAFQGHENNALELVLKNYSGLLVCSAGNYSTNIDTNNSVNAIPSRLTNQNIISVANLTSSNILASDSNYGSTSVDLAAPGESIYSTNNNSGYTYKSGTSMAAPFVTGVAALIKSKYPTITNLGIRRAIFAGVDQLSPLSGKVYTGGKLNAYDAISGVNDIHYTVQYNKTQGTGNQMPNTQVIYGFAETLRPNTYTRQHYNFSGWTLFRCSDNKWQCNDGSWQPNSNVSAHGGYKIIKNCAKIAHSTQVNGDVIKLYAQWQPIQFNMVFNGNGGVSYEPMSTQTISYGVPQSLYLNEYFYSGYYFAGWIAHRLSDNKWLYINSDNTAGGWYVEGTEPEGFIKYEYSDGESVSKTSTVDNDIIMMYAQWNPNMYKIKYNSNGGTGSMVFTRAVTNKPALLKDNQFTKENHIFIGWYLQDSYGYWSTTHPDDWFDVIPAGYEKRLYQSGDYVTYIAEEGDYVTAYAQWYDVSDVILGDLDQNGTITINDVTILQQYLAEFIDFTVIERYIADFNQDGVIDVSDITDMQIYLANN